MSLFRRNQEHWIAQTLAILPANSKDSAQFLADIGIFQAAPLAGPVAGGTLLTLDGIFGDPSVSVYRISVGQECILNTTSRNR